MTSYLHFIAGMDETQTADVNNLLLLNDVILNDSTLNLR